MVNFGQTEAFIRSNFKLTNTLPKSVIIEVGHEAYDAFLKFGPTGNVTQNPLQMLYGVMQALRDIGMNIVIPSGSYAKATGDNSYGSTVVSTALPNSAIFYYQNAAFHYEQTWLLSFATNLGVLYRPQFNSSNTLQTVDYNSYIAQPVYTDDNKPDSPDYRIAFTVTLISAVLFFLSTIIFAYLWYSSTMRIPMSSSSDKTEIASIRSIPKSS